MDTDFTGTEPTEGEEDGHEKAQKDAEASWRENAAFRVFQVFRGVLSEFVLGVMILFTLVKIRAIRVCPLPSHPCRSVKSVVEPVFGCGFARLCRAAPLRLNRFAKNLAQRRDDSWVLHYKDAKGRNVWQEYFVAERDEG